jgi:hypothetical protein
MARPVTGCLQAPVTHEVGADVGNVAEQRLTWIRPALERPHALACLAQKELRHRRRRPAVIASAQLPHPPLTSGRATVWRR